jgi:large repetitive protein
MTLNAESLDAFAQLAKAIGLLESNGQPNPSWFGDPIGAAASTGNQHGLRHLLADDDQREALLGFVDAALGPPERGERSGQTWVPLFTESDPHLTVYAVLEETAGHVRLGAGLEHTTASGPPRVATRVHVPLFRFGRRGEPAPAEVGTVPGWLLLGTNGARVEIGVAATFSEAAPPPGAAALAGICFDLAIPTAPGDQLGVKLELRGLQLPGASAPRDIAVDASSLDELGSDVLGLVLGLVRAQADALTGLDPALASFRAIAGLLGLRAVTGLPPLPLADLPVLGLSALVGWVEEVLADDSARDAWLGELASLVGGTVVAADDAVRIAAGRLDVTAGIRVGSGAAGHAVLVPWVELSLDTRAGARVRVSADLLRADTGTGACTALPSLRAEAVFGADAGGAALLSGSTPSVGSLHTGVALDPAGRPAFVLTLHDVIATSGGPTHDVLDVSSPSAALDSVTTVLEGALADAIDGLGPSGAFVSRLLGLDPPAGIDPLDVSAFFTDPLGAIRSYWRDLTADPAATADVLGRLRALLTGAPVASVPGSGTKTDPWRVDLADGVELDVWRDDDHLLVDLVGRVTTPVLTEYEVAGTLGITLLRADLSGSTAAFLVEAYGSLSVRREDSQPARLALGAAALEATAFVARASWMPGRGLRASFGAEDLAVVLGGSDERIPLSLPTLDTDGKLVLPTPDWDAVEQAAGVLLAELGLPVVDALLGLAGWTGTGAHLPLAGLVGADPGGAVRAWLADLVLDCDRIRLALGPVAALLNGFRWAAPLGTGSARDPFRCPVAGEPRAPGLAVWTEPGCPPNTDDLLRSLGSLAGGELPDPAALVGVLRGSAQALPDLADLLVGRDSLGEGLGLLLTRWAGTDGLVGRPAALPDDVTAVELDGLSYDELVALGSVGHLVSDVLDPVPVAVVLVGCEPTWVSDRPAGTAFDRSGADSSGTVPAAGGGAWFVRLPTPADAAAARPERGGVGEQAARLAGVLADRSDPVVLVGYGACGAAVIRAASTLAAVTGVVTVGTPWAGLAVDSLNGGLGGDALRLLRRLRRADEETWPDPLLALEATPLEQVRGVVRRSLDVLAPGRDLPSAGAEARRPGLAVHAVFGNLDEESLGHGLAAFVADGIRARAAASALGSAGLDTDGDTTPTAVHAGIDLPVTDLDLGGLRLGVGATVELCEIGPAPDGAPDGTGLTASPVRGVVVDVHLGVTDGWLVGGPGSGSTVGELRWMSARIDVPLDGRPGETELVLHEALGFGVDRERWVVRADATGAAPDVPAADLTTAVPEVRVLLADVVARLRAASADLAALLDLLGLVRGGGLDPDGLDRLLYDTAVTMRARIAAAPAEVASLLRALVPAATGTGTAVGWSVGPATVGVDLATGSVTGALRVTTPGLPPFAVDVATGPTNVAATASLGALDPSALGGEIGGGLRLHAGTSPAGVRVESAVPGGSVREVALLPSPDPGAVRDLATVLLPTVTAHGVLAALRQRVSSAAAAALDAALDALGLLTPRDPLGFRDVVLPIGLIQDPGGWLRHGVASWRTNAAASSVALLDALAPLVVPDRGAAVDWPIAEGAVVTYAVESGDRLRLVLDLSFDVDGGDGTTVTTHVGGGLVIGPDAQPRPTLDVSVDVDGRGLRFTVAPDTDPSVRLSLLRPPAAPLPVYPDGPGLGAALAAAGEMILPAVLDAISAHRDDAGTALVKAVGQAVFDLGAALDLRDGTDFTAARLAAFAENPAARLGARLPQLVSTGVAALAAALDPGGSVVAVTTGTGTGTGTLTVAFGTGAPVVLVLDASGAVPALELRADVDIDGVGRFVLERLRLSAAGVEVAALLGPVVLDLGSFALRPLLAIRAGSALGSGRVIGIGLALDDDAAQAVEFRWGLDAAPPTLTAVHRTAAGETLGGAGDASQWLLALALSLAGGLVADGLTSVLTAQATAVLQGVVFSDSPGSTAVDAALALDLLDADALLARLKRLLWNAAQEPALSVTLGGLVTIALASTGTTTRQLGMSLSIVPGRRFTLVDSDTRVELEVDANWVDPDVPAGLAIYVLSGTSATTLTIDPAVSVAGLGLRFTKASGPLLSLGAVTLDAIATHVYAEASPAGTGGGVRLELAGLAFSPGGGGGTNAVANSILNDAGQAGPSSRPAFSPSLAVQQHPGLDPATSLRAGPPPGPWWILVQRQLGPLYLERLGFDSVETEGTVSRISLYFDGRVSILGLTAAVDRLSLSWTGGDVLDVDNWAVDLMGFAVAADLSGASLAGGMRKTIGPPEDDGPVSYVGMLLGRFGVYGLSVFGGYTDDAGNPSFFVFGAINGPIGGPPAFFVTGLGGGLGINRGLRVPDDAARFHEFPFIAALDPAARPPEDPMDELRKLNTYFPPQRGSFWFAAGISFTSFALVDGIAVVAVSFGDGLEINLLGLARMALPRPEAALVSIELGLLARFSTHEGVFLIRAALTENSWLLYPDVRLSGGFAFATWWKGPLAGQFVLTLGGYHPDFHRDGYPDVPRLGLAWRVSDQIAVKGGAYLALTSEALMAGVDVEITANFGWAWARVAFGAHGIVYFDPFWYEVEAYARISAGVKISTFFGTVRISISTSGRITVWGPEFSGRARFEVGPCGITVPFGSGHRVEPRTLSWAEFVAKYLEDAGGGTARVLSAITGRGTLPAATGGDRSAPTSDGTPTRPFEVYAEFELTLVTTVPTSAVDVDLAGGPVPVPVVRSDGLPATLGLKPMRAGSLTSTLRIRLARRDPVTGVWTALPDQLRVLGGNLAAAEPRPEGSAVGRESFPIGAWGAPDAPGLPAAPLPKGDVVRAGNQVRLVAEATTMARGPEIDYYRVEASRRPLPLQAGGPSRGDLLATAGTVAVPQPTTVAAALQAAGERLFAVPVETLPVGVLSSGPRSGLARASYRGEVAAPPLFGTLADGMVEENADDATAARTPPAPAPEPRPLRPPVVVGYLTAGSGVAARASGTSVSDRRIKRRPAPTLDSVQARLGSHLPVRLHTVLAPATERSGTLAVERVPRTEATGAARSYPLGSSGVDGVVGGLTNGLEPVGATADGRARSARTEEQATGRRLDSGELVVLALPDASVDVPPTRSGPRPVLVVDGQARVTVLRGDGEVVVDTTTTDRLPLPAGAALVAVQADGLVDDGDGVAGWHIRSRVCSLGSHAALAAGCVLTADGGPTTRGATWLTAGELLADAAAVRTRFARPVRAVAIVVEEGDADRVDAVSLDLSGTRRATDANGDEQPPTVLLSGDQAVLVYPVEPQEPGKRPATVRVRAGGDWRVTGVLGAEQGVGELTRQVVRNGVVAAGGRLLAGTGKGCRISWDDQGTGDSHGRR